jgi:hypothetical protein
MTRIAASLAIWLALLLGADQLREMAQKVIYDQFIEALELGDPSMLTNGYNRLYVDIAVYICIFVVTGIAVAAWLKSTRSALLASFALGASIPAFGLMWGPPTPLLVVDHMPPWLETLSWANIYLRALACGAGTGLWLLYFHNDTQFKNTT